MTHPEQALYASADYLHVLDEISTSQQQAAEQQRLAGANARSRHRISSHGMGNHRLTAPIRFQLTFVGKPYLSHGVELVSSPIDSALPIATTGVYRWLRDARGFYTGAYLYVAVTVQTTIPGADLPVASRFVDLLHCLTFEGTALRDIDPDAVLED